MNGQSVGGGVHFFTTRAYFFWESFIIWGHVIVHDVGAVGSDMVSHKTQSERQRAEHEQAHGSRYRQHCNTGPVNFGHVVLRIVGENEPLVAEIVVKDEPEEEKLV